MFVVINLKKKKPPKILNSGKKSKIKIAAFSLKKERKKKEVYTFQPKTTYFPSLPFRSFQSFQALSKSTQEARQRWEDI